MPTHFSEKALFLCKQYCTYYKIEPDPRYPKFTCWVRVFYTLPQDELPAKNNYSTKKRDNGSYSKIS